MPRVIKPPMGIDKLPHFRVAYELGFYTFILPNEDSFTFDGEVDESRIKTDVNADGRRVLINYLRRQLGDEMFADRIVDMAHNYGLVAVYPELNWIYPLT